MALIGKGLGGLFVPSATGPVAVTVTDVRHTYGAATIWRFSANLTGSINVQDCGNFQIYSVANDDFFSPSSVEGYSSNDLYLHYDVEADFGIGDAWEVQGDVSGLWDVSGGGVCAYGQTGGVTQF